MGTPCLIHQPSYNMFNRWIERDGLKDTLQQLGMGAIVFTPLAQGMLTDKYLNGIPENSRAKQDGTLSKGFLTDDVLGNIKQLNAIAKRRGQTLAQMAIAWVLRDSSVTSALIGASKPQQVLDCVDALNAPAFTPAELEEIDQYAVESNINLWAGSSNT
jgi:L-glyceraldehyde 3-phosphate reductase